MTDERFYEAPAEQNAGRSAPAALRNREPIAAVLADWLPERGLILEIASGTGEHVVHFAQTFPALEWQPSDVHADALSSVAAWREAAGLPNVGPPIALDAATASWPIERADAIVSINMVHISPWESALGLLDGAARLLPLGGPLILYGPWLVNDVETAPGNLAFDADLKRRNPDWGLRRVEDICAEAKRRRIAFRERRSMPANNMMLLFRRED